MNKCIPLFILLFCAACLKKKDPLELIHVQLVDRSGFVETISQEEKMARLKNVDYEKPQPYQKITRVFKDSEAGRVLAKISRYHPNGELYQYLETVNGRCLGFFKEWHPSGMLRIQAQLIEGVGDLTPSAQSSWVFDACSRVFDEKGQCIAEIFYEKGALEGTSLYYFSSGALHKTLPYTKGELHGKSCQYDEAGTLVGETPYEAGVLHGEALFLGDAQNPPYKERYQEGRLLEATYADFSAAITHTISSGNGFKPQYEKKILRSEVEFREGRQEGLVKKYDEKGDLHCIFTQIRGKKEGPEWCYYPGNRERPLLYITWKGDEVHGLVRSFYENGVVESEKEMAHNKKEGISIAWYEDGSLMMWEEYRKGDLLSGKYFRKGEDYPISKVIDGNGLATLFESDGTFLQKVNYVNSRPE